MQKSSFASALWRFREWKCRRRQRFAGKLEWLPRLLLIVGTPIRKSCHYSRRLYKSGCCINRGHDISSTKRGKHLPRVLVDFKEYHHFLETSAKSCVTQEFTRSCRRIERSQNLQNLVEFHFRGCECARLNNMVALAECHFVRFRVRYFYMFLSIDLI